MKSRNINFYNTEDFSFEAEVDHLPLDWNEDLSLEEYLDRLDRLSEKEI